MPFQIYIRFQWNKKWMRSKYMICNIWVRFEVLNGMDKAQIIHVMNCFIQRIYHFTPTPITRTHARVQTHIRAQFSRRQDSKYALNSSPRCKILHPSPPPPHPTPRMCVRACACSWQCARVRGARTFACACACARVRVRARVRARHGVQSWNVCACSFQAS
jgi:hypothetical protein